MLYNKINGKYQKHMVKVDDGLSSYLREISKNEPLTSEQEAEAARRIRQGDEKAVEKLVKANLRFVVSVARNYENQGVPLQDLINEGNLGLIRAAYRFDEKRSFKFISYAVWWIRQSILQGLAEQSRFIRVPLNQVGHIHRHMRTRSKLEQKYGRSFDDEELAHHIAQSSYSETDDEKNQKILKAVKVTLRIPNRHISLNSPSGDRKNSSTLLDNLEDPNAEMPDEKLKKITLEEGVDEALSSLNEREKIVLKMYFGINEETAYTLEEIGVRTSITRERVRQVKDGALKKLRQNKKTENLRHHIL